MQNTENKFKYNGAWYIAVERDGCRNCYFIDKEDKCIETPPCHQCGRKGNRNVIFVESDADNLGDE